MHLPHIVVCFMANGILQPLSYNVSYNGTLQPHNVLYITSDTEEHVM